MSARHLLTSCAFGAALLSGILSTALHAQTTRPDPSFGNNGAVEMAFEVEGTRAVTRNVLRRAPELILQFGYANGDVSKPVLRAIAPDGTVRVPTAAEFVSDRGSISITGAGPTETPVTTACGPTLVAPAPGGCTVLSQRGSKSLVLLTNITNFGPQQIGQQSATDRTLYLVNSAPSQVWLRLLPTWSTGNANPIPVSAGLGPTGNAFVYSNPSEPQLHTFDAEGVLTGHLSIQAGAESWFAVERVQNDSITLFQNGEGRITRWSIPFSDFLNRSAWGEIRAVDVSQITTGSIIDIHRDSAGTPLFARTRDSLLIRLRADWTPDPSYGRNGAANIAGVVPELLAFYGQTSFDPTTGELAAALFDKFFVIDRNGVRRDVDVGSLMGRTPIRVAMMPESVAKDDVGRLLVSACGSPRQGEFDVPGAALVRLTNSGEFDRTFGTGGLRMMNSCGTLLAQADGTFVLISPRQSATTYGTWPGGVTWLGEDGSVLGQVQLRITKNTIGRTTLASERQANGDILLAYTDTGVNEYDFKTRLVRIPKSPTTSLTPITLATTVAPLSIYFAFGRLHWVPDRGGAPLVFAADGSLLQESTPALRNAAGSGDVDHPRQRIVRGGLASLCYRAAGNCYYDASLFRVFASGAADLQFGVNGRSDKVMATMSRFVANPSELSAVYVGKAHYYLHSRIGSSRIVRFHANGQLDLSFGTGGQVTIPSDSFAWTFMAEGEGKLLRSDGTHLLRDVVVSNVPSALQDSDGDGIPDLEEVARGTSPLWPDNQWALTDPATVVRTAFADVLNRAADAGAQAFYQATLEQRQMSREDVYGELFESQEFQSTMLPVARLYRATFARVPDIGGLRYWHRRLASGESLERLAELFAASPEFVARGPVSNADYVDRLYQNVIGRRPDRGGLEFWTTALDSQALTRGQLLARFSESGEYVAATRSDGLVDLAYLLLLNTSPYDSSGWRRAVANGLSARALASGFAGTKDFAARFVAECNTDSPALANPPTYCPR